jgi:hypothetical protein
MDAPRVLTIIIKGYFLSNTCITSGSCSVAANSHDGQVGVPLCCFSTDFGPRVTLQACSEDLACG